MNEHRPARHPSFILLSIIVFAAIMPTTANALDRLTSDEASCRVIEAAARSRQLSVAVLTKLLWFESRFQGGAVSPVGAQGIAQFMPATANERGLGDPFDVDLAIREAASFLAELEQRFGNIGLAIAAYNAGPNRVANWLDRIGALPRETSRLVLAVTGRTPEDWAAFGPYMRFSFAPEPQSCIALKALLRSISFGDLEPDRHLLPGMERSGRLLPGMNQSGRPLPALQRSGRLLPSTWQSGQPLR